MEKLKTCCECGEKRKHHDPEEYKNLMNRLKRIEGQIRGIEGMLEKEAYCTDILTQVAAANSALNSFSRVLLAEHMRTCVAEGLREGKEEVIEELLPVLEKLCR